MEFAAFQRVLDREVRRIEDQVRAEYEKRTRSLFESLFASIPPPSPERIAESRRVYFLVRALIDVAEEWDIASDLYDELRWTYGDPHA